MDTRRSSGEGLRPRAWMREEQAPEIKSLWRQVFGSVPFFILFLVQVFTGIRLTFNYTSRPGDAYNSLKYVLTEITAGRLIHGLHHWGASMMIVAVD